MQLQNMAHWHIEYFKMKESKKMAEEGHCDLL